MAGDYENCSVTHLEDTKLKEAPGTDVIWDLEYMGRNLRVLAVLQGSILTLSCTESQVLQSKVEVPAWHKIGVIKRGIQLLSCTA